MKEFLYAFGGFVVGATICYLYLRDDSDGTPDFKCEDKQYLVQYCVDSVTLDYNSVVNLDETMNGYFREAFRAGDSIGFSLDKTLVLGLAAYLNFDPESHGVRLYPGHDGSNKFVLIKPLDNEGNERSGSGAILETTDIKLGLGGPCPKWCGLDGRIIVPDEPE